MNKFGVLRGDIEDEYSKLGKAISGHKHSFVGIFYSSPEQSKTTILYRTFDGTRITYFGSYTSAEHLAKNTIISSVEILPFSEENWLADGKKDNLYDRFCKTVNRVLISSDSHRDYGTLLKSYMGITNPTFPNGYQIVNDIIMAAIGIGHTKRTEGHSKSLIEGRYFNHWERIEITMKEKICSDHLNIEVRSCFSQLFQAFIELLVTNKDYARRINEMIVNKKIDTVILSPTKSVFYDENLDLSSKSNVEDEMGYFRDVIHDIMEGFGSDKIPILQISELIESYNQMAEKLNQPQINVGKYKSNHKSIGVLVQTTSAGFYPDDVKVTFNCGKTVILPAKTGYFDDFTDDQMIQISRYVRSLNSIDGRFNYMLTEIVKELSTRNDNK
jgi:hypothetical protein